MSSPLSQWILWLHSRAIATGRVPEVTEESLEFMMGIGGLSQAEPTEAHEAGLQIYDGRPSSELARKVQRRSLQEARSLPLILRNVDERGYTALNVRALLQHFFELQGSPTEGDALGEDGWMVYADLTAAINAAPDRTRVVAWLLIAGFIPAEISLLLESNGSRLVNRAMREIARILEGKHNASTDTH